MAVSLVSLSAVHAGTIPTAALDMSGVRHEADSSSPGRRLHSRAGAAFEASESLPEIPAQVDNNTVDINTVSTGSVDINTASVEELAEGLPGIGPAKAQRIIDWREANGAFQSIEQLLEVSGIGPMTLENMRPYVRIGEIVSKSSDLRGRSKEEDAATIAMRNVIHRAVQDRSDALRLAHPIR
jgi:comEA protein